MKKNLAFRAWYYFRMGWSNYLTFLFSAVNTLTVTYYLAIDKVPALQTIFQSFTYYVIIVTTIAVPTLVGIGYLHFKKSSAYKAEADITYESHPHLKRILQNTESVLPLYLKMSEIMIKLSKNEKISPNELDEITKLQKQLESHIGKRLAGTYESNIYGSERNE
ncbi:MAG: hypothetical protein QW303_01015 [Nitrososphaerota archaeon]